MCINTLRQGESLCLKAIKASWMNLSITHDLELPTMVFCPQDLETVFVWREIWGVLWP